MLLQGADKQDAHVGKLGKGGLVAKGRLELASSKEDISGRMGEDLTDELTNCCLHLQRTVRPWPEEVCGGAARPEDLLWEAGRLES